MKSDLNFMEKHENINEKTNINSMGLKHSNYLKKYFFKNFIKKTKKKIISKESKSTENFFITNNKIKKENSSDKILIKNYKTKENYFYNDIKKYCKTKTLKNEIKLYLMKNKIGPKKYYENFVEKNKKIFFREKKSNFNNFSFKENKTPNSSVLIKYKNFFGMKNISKIVKNFQNSSDFIKNEINSDENSNSEIKKQKFKNKINFFKLKKELKNYDKKNIIKNEEILKNNFNNVKIFLDKKSKKFLKKNFLKIDYLDKLLNKNFDYDFSFDLKNNNCKLKKDFSFVTNEKIHFKKKLKGIYANEPYNKEKFIHKLIKNLKNK